jgi:hypothetical protein
MFRKYIAMQGEKTDLKLTRALGDRVVLKRIHHLDDTQPHLGGCSAPCEAAADRNGRSAEISIANSEDERAQTLAESS